MSINTIKQTTDIHIYVQTGEKGNVFVKEALTPEGKKEIEREYANQFFFWKYAQTHDLGFLFLKPVYTNNKFELPYLGDEFEWFGDSNTYRMLVPFEEYADVLRTFIAACHNIEIEKVSTEIIEDAQERFLQISKKFDVDIAYLHEKSVIDEDEYALLTQRFLQTKAVRAMQHHDLVPWHIARNRKTKQMYLVDAQWGGVSFYCYDLAYFLLQVIGYGDDEKTAKDFYEKVTSSFIAKESVFSLFLGALAYRGVRLLAELHRKDDIENIENLKLIMMHTDTVF